MVIGQKSIFIRCANISKRVVGRLKCRWACLKQQWTCTSHINLVGFYPLLLKLMRLNCVQHASISTRVNSSMFTRGQHVCASLLVTRGQTAMLGKAIHRALPRIAYPANTPRRFPHGSRLPLLTGTARDSRRAPAGCCPRGTNGSQAGWASRTGPACIPCCTAHGTRTGPG